MDHGSAIISLRGISRGFTSGDGTVIQVLNDVNLDIERGSFNVIRGESGSGKTTLLRILGMLDTGFTGDFLFDGVSVGGQPDWYLDELRANNLGFIFQEGRLFKHMTLRRNVEVPLILHGMRNRADIDAVIARTEPTFYSETERKNRTLDLAPGSASGGQAQRASIMRAILNDPSIILADEPTASLHGNLKQEVVEHLKSLCDKGHTVIVVSHDSVFYDTGRQLELDLGVLRELSANHPLPDQHTLPTRMPEPSHKILGGWKPRAPFGILLRQAIRETLFRPLFLSLILVSLIVGVCQVSVFTSVIVGAQAYVNEKITEGSRLNRIQIKPRSRDLENDERFPMRAEIAALGTVDTVVARRASTTRVVVKVGDPKTFSATGLHPDDPEYKIMTFVAGGSFSGAHDAPEVILTTALVSEIFDTTAMEAGTQGFADFIGRDVSVVINRYNAQRKLAGEVPVRLKLAGIILNGEGGRQVYFPNTTLRMFDALIRDRSLTVTLPENAGPGAWPDPATIEKMTDFPWEDSLHVYAKKISDVLPLFSALSEQGLKPQSDIWDFKWALDVQDTAWRIFVPLLGLIVASVVITVAANIFTSAKLRETELALWRVLGMRRGDLVLTQIMSIMFSVSAGALAGLGLGALLVQQTKQMLEQRSIETARAIGGEVEDFDAIFAPVGTFFWPVMAAAVLIGILAALYPAYRTAKTDPARVLQS